MIATSEWSRDNDIASRIARKRRNGRVSAKIAPAQPTHRRAPVTFDSLSFLAFLVLIYAVYWCVRTWRVRKMLLLGASYLFYGAWNPFFVLLIVATTGFDWLAGRWMERVDRPAQR